ASAPREPKLSGNSTMKPLAARRSAQSTWRGDSAPLFSYRPAQPWSATTAGKGPEPVGRYRNALSAAPAPGKLTLMTYADDLVILCRKGKAEEALQRLREIMGKLKLTVNEEKTRICKVPDGEFDFLGYTFGRMYSARTGKAYLGFRPSKKSIKRMVE